MRFAALNGALLGVGLVLAAAPLLAQEVMEEAPVPPPPPMPESLPEDAVEPEVTIIRREHETVTEYRVNGQLYMVKVTPLVGKPYYLMDSDGDGSLETQRHALQPGPIPHWVLINW
jgi:hypothetical protein